jgi:hypothetical protein
MRARLLTYVPEGRVDPPAARRCFPGAITIPGKTCEQVLECVAHSFKPHGIRGSAFPGDQGGCKKSLGVGTEGALLAVLSVRQPEQPGARPQITSTAHA